MIPRLLWTICQLLVILLRIQGVTGAYEGRLSRIEEGLRRMDDHIYDVEQTEG